MLQRRPPSRVVWFRISPDEFDNISEFCARSGISSIAELCRSAVWWFTRVEGDVSHQALANEVCSLRSEMQRLAETIAELNLLLGIEVHKGAPVS